MTAARDPRRLQTIRIKMAQKQLGLDDDTYRSLLRRVTNGKSSTTTMTAAERNAVIAEFVRLGFKEADRTERRKHFPGRPKNCDQVPMLLKVEALLADSKRPWSYAHAMSKQMFHVNRVEWLRDEQLHKLVSALQIDAKKRGK